MVVLAGELVRDLTLLSVAGSNQLTADRGVVLACWIAGLLVGGVVAGRRELRHRLL